MAAKRASWSCIADICVPISRLAEAVLGAKEDIAASGLTATIIMSDEHTGGVTGIDGHPAVRTPHLDALAHRRVAVDRQGKEDQSATIAQFGGPEMPMRVGAPGATPPPI
jgi:hypothetical protein